MPSVIKMRTKGQKEYCLNILEILNLKSNLNTNLNNRYVTTMRMILEKRKFGVLGKKPFEFYSIEENFSEVELSLELKNY